MSPVGHSSIALLGWQKSVKNKRIKTLLLFLLISNFPDIDFLFSLFIGKKTAAIHQYYTHNIFFVCVTALLFFPIIKPKRERIGFFLVAFSHLLLDLWVIDTVPPIGFRLFYPLSNQVFNFGIFPNMERGNLADVFTLYNFWVLALEAAVFLVPVVIYYRKSFGSYIKQKEFWELKCKS
jgi:membrane-bound metal-dependent hydrolase YbcI (DUF457 family)